MKESVYCLWIVYEYQRRLGNYAKINPHRHIGQLYGSYYTFIIPNKRAKTVMCVCVCCLVRIRSFKKISLLPSTISNPVSSLILGQLSNPTRLIGHLTRPQNIGRIKWQTVWAGTSCVDRGHYRAFIRWLSWTRQDHQRLPKIKDTN